MKHDIEKALQSIPVPELEDSVKAGIARAERNRITMTRSVKKIAAIAAALVLCIGIVGAAALVGRKGDSNKILTADDISLKFNGFNQNGTLNLSAEYIDSGKEVEIPYNLSSYTIVDENGEVVAVSDGDRLETKGIGLVYYWSDVDGQLYFSEIYSGKYTVIFHADNTMESTQIEGEWTIDVDLEELNYQVFFDPRKDYQGSVEEGTAYIADSSDITVEFVDADEPLSLSKIGFDADGNLTEKYFELDDSDKVMIINIISDEAPFKDIKSIGVSSCIIFDENREYSGGFASVPLEQGVGIGPGSAEFDWGLFYRNAGQVYIINDGEDQGRRCTVKIYSFIAELSDGSCVEIQGDWMVDFTV